jgi:hypothetical protein
MIRICQHISFKRLFCIGDNVDWHWECVVGIPMCFECNFEKYELPQPEPWFRSRGVLLSEVNLHVLLEA